MKMNSIKLVPGTYPVESYESLGLDAILIIQARNCMLYVGFNEFLQNFDSYYVYRFEFDLHCCVKFQARYSP